MRQVYMDYSATTPVKKEVLDAMMPYFTEHFGNPSSLYTYGLEAKDAITKARGQLAHLIGANPDEVYFTGSGSEADNWTLFGVTDKLAKKGNHIITTQIEHHAILHSSHIKGINPSTVLGHHGVGIFWNVCDWTIE